MRAAIYCRVSSQGQEDGYSLDDQEAKGRAFCDEHDYEVVGVWREVYTGAALFGRPKLMALMGEVERGTVERVILSHPDRQTRDMLDLGWLVREAERHGAKFEFVEAEADFGTPEGVIIGGIRAFAAQTTRTINAKKSVDAVRRRVEVEGRLIGGHPPRYGYRFGPETDRTGKPTRERYEIEPEQAATVRLIFERIAASVPKMTLCKELMRRGVPNPGFNRQRDRVIRWKPFTIEGIVRDEKYRGVAFVYKINQQMDDRGNRTRQVRPEGDWVRLPEGVVPRMVSDELWHQANAALDRVKPGRNHSYAEGKDPQNALCRGSVTCSCGFKMIVHKLEDGGYYRCQGKQRKANDCGNMIRTKTVDQVVWERALWIATDPGLAIEQHRSQAAVERTEEDTTEIDRAIDRAEQDERNLTEALTKLSGAAQATVIGRLQEVADRRAVLAERRAEIELTRLALERESAIMRGWLDQWAVNIAEMQTMDFDAKRHRLAQMGIEAIVGPKVSGPDRVQVVLNLPFDRAILRRDPDRPEFNWTAEDDRDYDRFTRLFETPDGRDPSQTPDTPPLSPSCGNSRSAPCTEPSRWRLAWTSDDPSTVA